MTAGSRHMTIGGTNKRRSRSEICSYGAFALLMSVLPSLARAESEKSGLSSPELIGRMGIAAAVVGILGLIAVEFFWRGRLRRTTYRWLLFLGLFVLPVISMMGVTATVFEETKSVASCRTCHIMEPFVDDMRNTESVTLAARHYKNRWIPDHQCYSCHTTYGVHGTLASKRDGFRHWLLYVTRTYEEPIRYSGSYPNSNCISCHVGTPKYERVNSHHALAEYLSTDKVNCFTCHGLPHPSRAVRDPALTDATKPERKGGNAHE